ncbi:MAG: DNA polymerase, partial [Anaerolineales bacterium]
SYFERLPGLKRYIDDSKRFAAEHGYVESLLGRRRYFPGLTAGGGTREGAIAKARAEREAINAPIQATAADMIKLAMLRLPAAFAEAGLKAAMLLQVHDELVVECPTQEVPQVAKIMCDVMENAFKLDVPVRVDVRAGTNWEEMLYSPAS